MTGHPSSPRPSLIALLSMLASATASAQPTDAPTQLVWALDAGVQTSANPILRVHDPAGREVFFLGTLPGSGQARGITFDDQGLVYLARGDLVHQLDAAGVATGVTFNPPTGGVQAQDMVTTPDGKLIISWGATQAASRIGVYDLNPPNATPTVFLGPTGLNQPRRLAVRREPGNGTCYVANRDSKIISSFNYLSASPTLSQVIDLTTQNIGPVGLAHDPARDRLFVVGDWGSANQIAIVSLSPSPTVSALVSYPTTGATGLRSPTGCYFDRFRRLYVAGRNQNTGTPGVYVFNAEAESTLAFLATFPVTTPAPTNVVDVDLQPKVIRTCTPLFNNAGALAVGANTIFFRCPDYPGRVYAAALSLRWTAGAACPTGAIVPGILEPALRFSLPDCRGMPLKDDFLFRGTAAVAVPGPSPVPGGLDLTPFGLAITGFIGTLDATGLANATVVCPGGFTGVELSLAWVVMDPNIVSQIGYVSQPACLVVQDPAAVVVQPVVCP